MISPIMVFFGTSPFAIPILEALHSAHMMPRLIITVPDAPQGRGLRTLMSPVKEWAILRGSVVMQPPHLHDAQLQEQLQDIRAQLFVVAAYGKIIPLSLLDIPSQGALNVHPSLLPKYRGPSPVANAILAGEQETGVTIMLVDKEMDHGPLLARKTFDLKNKKYTGEELEKELAVLGGKLLVEVVPLWLAGKIIPQSQDHEQATFTKKITKKDGLIQWREDAYVIERKVRAFHRWPGAFTFWDRKGKRTRIAITRARVHNFSGKIPGEVFTLNDHLVIACGRNALVLEALKIEGKKEMSGVSLVHGHKDIVGTILTQ